MATPAAVAAAAVAAATLAANQALPTTAAQKAIEKEKKAWNQLMMTFGLNQETIDELERHGIGSMESLQKKQKTSFNAFFIRLDKVHHPLRPQNAVVWMTEEGNDGIRLAHTWLQRREWVSLKTNAASFTLKQQIATRKRNEVLADKVKSNKDKDLKAPLKFKGFAKWDEFIKSIDGYLGKVRGAADTPLSYVTRETELVETDDVNAKYDTTDDFFIRCVRHAGSWFEADNERVWDELEIACQSTTAWEYIKQFDKKKDGRKAYLKLMSEGVTTNSKAVKIQRAYNTIRDTVWQGTRNNWTFDNFVDTFVKAYNDLVINDEFISEAKKVRDFLANIEDPRCEGAKVVIFGSADYLDNFTKCHQYLQTVLTNMTVLKAGSGGGGRHGRRGIKSAGKGGHLPFTGKLEAGKRYSNDIFKRLTNDQKDELNRLRGNKPTKKQRKAAAAKKRALEDSEETDTPGTETGDEFGSNAHNNKKPK